MREDSAFLGVALAVINASFLAQDFFFYLMEASWAATVSSVFLRALNESGGPRKFRAASGIEA